MLLKEAKEILKANGFILEGAYRDLIHQKIGEIRLNKKESEGRVAQSKRKAAKVLRIIPFLPLILFKPSTSGLSTIIPDLHFLSQF